jgi:hypothetical protein
MWWLQEHSNQHRQDHAATEWWGHVLDLFHYKFEAVVVHSNWTPSKMVMQLVAIQ